MVTHLLELVSFERSQMIPTRGCLDRSDLLHCPRVTFIKGAGMVQRRQRERSLFEVLLPDGHKLGPDWLRRIDTLLEDGRD